MTISYEAPLNEDENTVIKRYLSQLEWNDALASEVSAETIDLIKAIRKTRRKPGSLESFFQQYSLNTEEGLALMSMAEALLRIPDSHVANKLIRDKIAGTNWLKNKSDDKDWLTKIAGVGLNISGSTMNSLLSKLGEPVIREAMVRAMKVLGKQFVVGETLPKAIKKSKSWEEKGFRFSYDILGEGARTFKDADYYFQNYKSALEDLSNNETATKKNFGISVKLSALHPRFELLHTDFCVPYLVDKLTELCEIASAKNLSFTIDAEEVARIYPTLKVFEGLLEKDFSKWEGLGIAIQAYHKSAISVIDYVYDIAQSKNKKIQVRLVKGAYWDTEIKHSQINGHDQYPVFTRKENSDLSYLLCAQKLFDYADHIYPMFGTHNAHTVAAIQKMAGKRSFEFQKLYGMGDALFNHMNKENPDLKISIYAPVGPHQDLLPYLVRRMLENGANSSFVNQIYNKEIKPEQIAQDVISKISERNDHAHPQIPLPKDIYGQARDNSKGLNFDQKNLIDDIQNRLKQFKNKTYKAMPVLEGQDIHKGTFVSSFNPANGEEVGQVTFSQSTIVDEAFEIAKTGHVQLSNLYAYQRAEILERFAKKIDEHRFEIINLCVKEAGRTILDSDNEVREAIDFCRYYAALGRKDFNENGISLKSPTGETNHYYQKSRGIFVCISPWNFPVAIYIGQMAAALMAGNAVITKPAEQTSLIGYYLIRLLLDSGLPKKAISFLPGDGELGALIVDHQDVSGVAFTGSTEVAKKINQSLANRVGEIPKLIAETGGQNAMIIDSSALTEQVIDDALLSAFGSAGQRCSACRILYVQDDVADKTIEMIRGAMETLIVGDPQNLNTDIGPLIDEEALMHIQKHKSNLDGFGDKIAQVPLTPEQKAKGSFFASCAYEIPNIQFLDKEHFGPVLHVIRFHMKEIDHVIDDINSTGYGLTFGVHSRIQSFIDHIISRIHVGNIYVNKPIIGAVVGVQPFGGRGLSGTGPKAGGPQYLRGFASEKVVSVDTTRAGGNTSLVMLD